MFHCRNARRALKRGVAAGLGVALLAAAGRGSGSGDPGARREDLAAFQRSFFLVDHAYSTSARAEATKRLAALTARVDELPDARFLVELAQIVALADNGHTAVIGLGSSPELARIGLRLTPFGEEFYVVRAESAHADLLGGRLVSIDGVPLARLRDSARTLRGGIPAWRDRGASLLFESPGLLHAMGISHSASAATYHFQLGDGTTRSAVLAPLANGPVAMGHGPVVAIDPADDGSGWKTLLAPGRAPWSLQEFGDLFRRRDAPELDAVVIQLHANVDAGGRTIAGFLEESDSARKAAHRRNVVLDMRFNGGGNLQLTRAFLTSLPARLPPGGRIVVLTSPWTFSAAISSTAYLKQAGGDRVTLVGEAPGDRLQFWAEGQPISLPHSGMMILPATERHDYLTGCKPFTDCHRAVVQYPIAVKTLAPDVAAPWTIEAYATGRDPGMEAVARVLGKR